MENISKKPSKTVKFLSIFMGAILLLGAIKAIVDPNPTTVKKQQATQEELIKTLPRYTAKEMVRDYANNTLAADKKYKDQQFVVTGVVTQINSDFMGDPYITLSGANQFLEPHFEFNKSAAAQLAQVQKGAKLTLLCKGKGDLIKVPVSGNCQIIQP